MQKKLAAAIQYIDAALGEVPPEIFGRAVRVTIAPPSRVRKARGGTDVRRAAAKARVARRTEKAFVRAARTRARQEKERMKTLETREEVHSIHAKRRLLDPPYDPYEAAPRASLARELHFARGVIQADALLVDLHQAHFGLFLGHARAGLHDVVHEPSRVAADLLVSVEDGREQGHAEVAL